MKIFRNIGPVLWGISRLPFYKKYKKLIFSARGKKDYVEEKRLMAEALGIFGKETAEHLKLHITIKGRKNIDMKNPILFASNHESYMDIFSLIFALDGKQYGFIARKNLRRIPFFGKWMEILRCLFIDRGNGRNTIKLFKSAEELMKKGFSFVIFPGGTRMKGKGIGEFQKGSLKIATDIGAKIIPIRIKGTYEAFEKYGYFHEANISIEFFKAIETKYLTKNEKKNIHLKIEEIIS